MVPTAAMEPASRRAVSRVVDVLDYHLRHRGNASLGRGPDGFHDEPMDHPTALALYAGGLVHLHVATGETRYADGAVAVADRLIATGRQQPERGFAWGLCFPWRHLGAEEPFAITTAIATRALVDVHEVVGHAPALRAAARASQWLVDGLPWRVTGRAAAPWYSPRCPYVLPNVAGLVAAALRRAVRTVGGRGLEAAARQAIEFVLTRQHTSTGLWRYGYAGQRRRGKLRPPDVADALHMTYTLEGLMSAAGGTGRARWHAAAKSGFDFIGRELVEPSGRLRERAVLASRVDEDAIRLVEAKLVDERPADHDAVLLVPPNEARVAAYGALIGALARARDNGLSDETLLDRLVSRVLVVHAADISGSFRYLPDDPRAFPRQEAHLFEGLAAFVRMHPANG